MNDLRCEVRDKSFACASAMLDGKTAPTAATIEAVRALVDIAISIDLLNLRWEEQNRSYAAARLGSVSQLREAGSSAG